jgi:hypothetical protein
VLECLVDRGIARVRVAFPADDRRGEIGAAGGISDDPVDPGGA